MHHCTLLLWLLLLLHVVSTLQAKSSRRREPSRHQSSSSESAAEHSAAAAEHSARTFLSFHSEHSRSALGEEEKSLPPCLPPCHAKEKVLQWDSHRPGQTWRTDDPDSPTVQLPPEESSSERRAIRSTSHGRHHTPPNRHPRFLHPPLSQTLHFGHPDPFASLEQKQRLVHFSSKKGSKQYSSVLTREPAEPRCCFQETRQEGDLEAPLRGRARAPRHSEAHGAAAFFGDDE